MMEISNDPSTVLSKIEPPPHQLDQKEPLGDTINLSKYSKVRIASAKESKKSFAKFQIALKDPELVEKIFNVQRDLLKIEKILPDCQDITKREILLDRGLVLSAFLNEVIKKYNISINDLQNSNIKKLNERTYVKNPSVTLSFYDTETRFNPELLNMKYWTEQKIDRFEKTAERKLIPCEFWYRITQHNFSKELHKNFALSKKNFKNDYDFIFRNKDEL